MKPNRLSVVFNNTAFKALYISLDLMKIFFMDKANSPKFFPNDLETTGSWIKKHHQR